MKKHILSRSAKQNILIGIICTIVVSIAFAIAYFVTMHQVRSKYDLKVEQLESEMGENQRTVYVTKAEILAGNQVTEENVELKTVYSSMPQDYFIDQEDMGKIAKINIPVNAHVAKEMITPEMIEDGLREEQFNVFYLSSNLKEHDFVDVRLTFPNGEDYIVLSKKAVKNLSLENSLCYMWLDEEEILTVSGAIVDAFVNEGAKLYTVKYIEPAIQEASIVTYIPSAAVIELIRNDENVVKVAARIINERMRLDLEERLKEYQESHPGADLNYNLENYQDHIYEEVETEETYRAEEDEDNYAD